MGHVLHVQGHYTIIEMICLLFLLFGHFVNFLMMKMLVVICPSIFLHQICPL